MLESCIETWKVVLNLVELWAIENFKNVINLLSFILIIFFGLCSQFKKG